MTRRRLGGAGMAALASVVLGGCSVLDVFNAVVPRDAGVERIANDVAYGPDDRQHLDIYAPRDRHGALPVVFFIYGGSWNSGSKDDYAFVGNAFAAKGYVTVIADYRLVPKIRYPVFVEDNAKALAWTFRTITRYGGDPERIFVAAHSAGAYDALMLAADPEFLKAEGLSTRIIRAVAGLSGPYDFLPLDVDATKEAFKGVADLKATQPINHVHKGMPPTFVACGSADTLVKPRNTRTMAERLAAARVPHEMHVYDGLGHAAMIVDFARPFRGRAPVLADVVAFFRAHGGA